MRASFALAAVALALSSPAPAVDWVQGNWQGGAVAGSTTSLYSGWTRYDSQDGNVVVLSTGLQSLPRGGAWTQSDTSTGTTGFALAGSVFLNTLTLPTSPKVTLELVNTRTLIPRSAVIPHQRSAMAVSTFAATGKIYLFGGLNNDDGTLSNQILQYDPVADSISAMPTVLPSSAEYLSAVYHPGKNKIYLFGGYNGCTQPCGLNTIWEYDPVAGTINTKTAALPTGRFAGAAAYHPSTNKIYYFGGTQGGGSDIYSHTTYYHQILDYDPVADVLAIDPAPIPPPPAVGNNNPGCGAYLTATYAPPTNKIYLLGGADFSGTCSGLGFDVFSDTLAQANNSGPSPRGSATYDPVFNDIYYMGIDGTLCPGFCLASSSRFVPSSNSFDNTFTGYMPYFHNDPIAYLDGPNSIFIFGMADATPKPYVTIYQYKFIGVGTYTSAVYDTGNTASLGTISWDPIVQSTTAVALAVGFRAGPTPAPDANWTNGGAFATVANGASLASFGPNRYVQYIATFTTTIPSSSPVLNDITINYVNYPPSAALVSSAFNGGGPLNVVQKVAWQGLFPSSAPAQFQIRTASDNGSGFPGAWGPWLGPTSANDYYTDLTGGQAVNAAQTNGVGNQWFQYKATLISTNVFATPTLATVTVTTNLMPVAPAQTSLIANTSTQLTASWTDNSNNEDEFVVSSGTASGATNLGTAIPTASKAGTGGSQSAAIAGLSPNTTYYVRLRAHALPPVGLYSFYSNESSLATLAAPPAGPAATSVYVSSAVVAWNAGGNPAGTPFEVSISTDNFALNVSTPVPFAANLTGTTTTLLNLAAGTTYYFRVRAQNVAGLATAFTVAASTPTLPGALTPPSGAALGVSSVAWSWTNTLGPIVQSYQVYSAATGQLLAATTSTAYVQTGLAVNTAAAVAVAAVDASGAGPLSSAATAYTLAAPPSAPAFSAVYISSLTLAWNAGADPAGTTFQVARSTDGISYTVVGGTTAAAFADAQIGNATYYYEVRALNAASVPTAFTAAVSTFMAGQPPAPPSGLALANPSGTAVTLSWSASPGPNLLQYDVYWDSGTGAINYGATFSTVPASTTSFATGMLSPGTYYFAVRAMNQLLLEERNTNVAASIAVLSSAPVANWTQTQVLFPRSGKVVWGNRVTLDAGLLRGNAPGTGQVLFQYRAAGSTTTPWSIVPAAEFNNPVVKPPFYIHWDVTALAPGGYEVRAVASNAAGQADPNPPTTLVTASPAAPDVQESLSGGALQHLETVSNAVDNAALVGSLSGGQTLQVSLPAGALGASTSTVLQILSPALPLPAAPANLTSAGISAQITLQNGQTALGALATLTAVYPDQDNDGIVDGTTARADRLAFLVYNPGTGLWQKENPSTVDTANKTVGAQTPHFSLFGLFATAAAALDSVRVYPNPYRPNGGNPDQGRPFSLGDPLSGIVFDNLTQGARVQIFDVSGELVWQTSSDSTSGKIQWDARNSAGRDVATGGYVAVVRDLATGRSVVKKIAIIRH